MGKVQVLVPLSLRSYWGGPSRVAVDARTLGDALGGLGALTSRILDDTGAVRPHVHLFVNQQAQTNLDVTLRDGDIIHILPAVSGGRS